MLKARSRLTPDPSSAEYSQVGRTQQSDASASDSLDADPVYTEVPGITERKLTTEEPLGGQRDSATQSPVLCRHFH